MTVGYRAFLLLKAMLARPGEIFTKAELFEAGWPGAVVEETNLSVQIATLRKALGAPSGDTEWITTIPRVGYRFQAEVAVLEAVPPTARRDTNPGGGPRPSIAVLPFSNLSPDPEHEYLADGIVEDIIAGLSRLRWLAVVARNSSFAYKGKTVDILSLIHI